MGTHHVGGEHRNRGDQIAGLSGFSCICLGTLFFAYSVLAFRVLLERGTFGALDLFLISVRLVLSGMVLLVVVDPPWLARRLDRQIDLMGSLFEQAFANSSTKEKIRLIVLVTMVSLLLELVMIRWLASVFPVFSLLQEFHAAGLLPGPGRGVRRCGQAALRPGAGVADACPVCRRHHAAALRYRRGERFLCASPMHEQTSVGCAAAA